ncbi:Protein of unknown function [Pyronema omphalodes CBS 100304]|uniref:Uncharacterized protein n=1 Tax=Pyronema omphalodes (strain CBS 100304) TaxID=1076935 RepID=U4LTX4_PYROM|nr:Protein of unknown function [Pyronema omphalodes CBS 100304]
MPSAVPFLLCFLFGTKLHLQLSAIDLTFQVNAKLWDTTTA